MMDIIETLELLKSRKSNQRLSIIVDGFLMCDSCKIVDRDRKRSRVDYKCPHCETPSKGGHQYFLLNADILIDLMGNLYRPKQKPASEGGVSPQQNKHDQAAIVIFFCSLGEVLLDQFLQELMLKAGLSQEIHDRLFEDNLFMKQRLEKLFPALTGVKWIKAVKMLNEGVNRHYIETHKFYQRMSKVRNDFLHKGMIWSIRESMPEQCIRHIPFLLHLFVDLHNEYVASRPVKKP